MRRREFISLLGGAVVTSPLVARAQELALPVIGFLNSGSPAELAYLVAAFNDGLNDAGFVDGHNVRIEYRWARNQYGQLSTLAAELVARDVSVIAASGGTVSALAAKAATAKIPIVFLSGGDPVADGLVGSLARPGGNITGISVFSIEMGAKRLELLRELVPTATLISMLVNPAGTGSEQHVVQTAADKMGQQLRVLNISSDDELNAAFATMVEQQTGGLLVSSDPFFTSRCDQLILLTTRHGIPTVFPWREYATGGGLLSYGTSLRHSYRQMAGHVARILNGEKAAELPTQHPTTFEFVLNLKAARVLGLAIPTSILLRADEVIE